MTECERIIQSGRIGRDFLKEETRCDFFVDLERKKLWMISLDLLMEFDRFCRKHGMQYYLAYGTLLGAIRHKGFIPWDDDVDVYMLREDYDKLPSFQDEFEFPYFLETPYNDPGYLYSPIRLRNSNTTAIVEKFKYAGFNQGIWLSVFPIDNWIPEGGEEKYNQVNELLKDCSTCMRMSHPHLDDNDKLRVQNYHGLSGIESFEKIHAIASQFKGTKTEYVANMVCTTYPYRCLVYRSDAFQSTVYKSFEGFEFPVPIGYDHILRTLYGEYMSFPPVEKRGTWHYGYIADPDKPYQEYLKDLD